MIIYKDILTGDEMFSDIYKIKETDMMYEVEGKMVTRGGDEIDDSLIGGNASAEGGDEGTESSSVSGIDIVLNHKLTEMPGMDKKTFLSYAKDYMKAVKSKLEEDNPGRVEEFMKGAPAEVKKLVGTLKDLQFFCGESQNPDGCMGFLNFREDGITPFMLFFKDGLEKEKC